MKSINDYVLQAIENLSEGSLSEEDLEKELKKAEAITKLAEVSIKDKEADTKKAEVDNRKTEMFIKVKMMKAQITGEVPDFDSIPLQLTTSKKEEAND